jgi:putative transposase
MKRQQAFKFELMPNGQQQRDIHRFAGACRFVFNKALALQKENHAPVLAAGNKPAFIGYVAMARHLTAWRQGAETPWLKEAPCHPLQHALKDLERSYKNFFSKRALFSRFKRKSDQASFRYPDAKQFKLDSGNARIFLPKLGWMRLRLSRSVLGALKNATLSCRAGRWYVNLQTEREIEQPLPQATTAVGIDMGIAHFATMSDASYFAALNSFEKHEARLACYQRKMSRKVKGSQNRHKSKRRVQCLHASIANVRQDFLHKSTSQIAKAHALVCIEDLKVRNMNASAAGTHESPGKNIKAKSGLNKAILDQGWFEFRRQLEYKLAWTGGLLVAVPPHNTSWLCPHCGHVARENRLSQALFLCVAYGHTDHADVVGAINVLERGRRLLACGEDGSGLGRKPKAQPASMKQEPTEATKQEATLA